MRPDKYSISDNFCNDLIVTFFAISFKLKNIENAKIIFCIILYYKLIKLQKMTVANLKCYTFPPNFVTCENYLIYGNQWFENWALWSPFETYLHTSRGWARSWTAGRTGACWCPPGTWRSPYLEGCPHPTGAWSSAPTWCSCSAT